MAKFKKVDEVNGHYADMGPGDIDTVVYADSEEMVLDKFGRGHNPASFTLVGDAGWDYAEADRLERAAKDAIKSYNEYVQRQPKRVYLPMYLPD